MQRTDEELRKAFSAAPKVIQDALSDGPAVDFMVGLQARYGLHIDVAGTVVERIRDLLLGLSNPTEFLGELVNLGIADTTARTVVADLNTEVFIPLRDRMREEGTKPAPPEPPMRKPIPPPAIDYQPPVAQSPATLPGSPVAAPMPAAQSMLPAMPIATQIVPQGAVPEHPQGWHPAAAVHIYVPQGPASQQPASVTVPDATPPATNLVRPADPVRPTPEPIVREPRTPAPAPSGAAATPATYTSDPYREPI